MRRLLFPATEGERWVLAGWGWRVIRCAVALAVFVVSYVLGMAGPWPVLPNAATALATGAVWWFATWHLELRYLRRHPHCGHCTHGCTHCCYCRSPLPPMDPDAPRALKPLDDGPPRMIPARQDESGRWVAQNIRPGDTVSIPIKRTPDGGWTSDPERGPA